MKNRRAFYIALLVALAGAALVKFALDSERKRLAGTYEMVTVVVASKDILRYEIIKEDMLSLMKVPKPYVQPLAILAGEEGKIIGFQMADINLKKGEQLSRTKLALIGESGISPHIPTQMRACTVSINDITGVGGLIRNSDTVDVIGTFRVVDKGTRIANNVEAVTLFQNIRVLAVGRNYIFDRPAQAQENKNKRKLFAGGNSGSLQFSNITLLLSPRQCMDLSVAQQVGEITLSLRSYHDRFGGKSSPSLNTRPSTTESATGLKAPVQINKAPRWLEIRGNNSSLVP